MAQRKSISMLLAGTMMAGLMASPALAGPEREAELEARLKMLESAVQELRAELVATKAQSQAAADASAKAAASSGEKVAALEASWAKQPKPEDGFKVGGTTIKLNGYFKANASISMFDDGATAARTAIRDFYVPSQIPVGGTGEGKDYEGNAKQTRMWLTTSTPIGGHTLKGHLEFDFQTSPGTEGNQRTTNGYNLAMRRAFIAYDDLLVGQEWSNFQYTPALPESTDYVGPSEGTVFVRQMQIRYTKKLSPQVALSASVENAETASITSASATMTENADDRMPDITARLLFTPSFGEFSLAGVVRKLAVDTRSTAGGLDDSATGWGLSFAGKVPFGPDKRHDIRFMISKGDGIGRYLGLNFAPDAVFTAAGRLETVDVTAGFAAVKLGWTAKLRSTFMGSFQKVDYATGLAPLTANESAWSVAGNLFYSPVKNLDFGLEYRHAVRELVSGAKGQMDRLEFAAKYSF